MGNKSSVLAFILLLAGSGPQVAQADTQYELRVDGMACPYCAYGIEKKLKALGGVIGDSLQVKLNEGIVRFNVVDPTNITEPDLDKLINDSGFTLRSVTVQNVNPGEQVGDH